MDFDKQIVQLQHTLRRNRLDGCVRVERISNDIDGHCRLVFEDGRQAFGSFNELLPAIEQATNLDMLLRRLEEQLTA